MHFYSLTLPNVLSEAIPDGLNRSGAKLDFHVSRVRKPHGLTEVPYRLRTGLRLGRSATALNAAISTSAVVCCVSLGHIVCDSEPLSWATYGHS